MGRTLPSAAQVFQSEEESLSRYRRALRRADQRALDELFNFAQAHVAEAAYAAHAMPMEIYLLSMLLEEHKQVVKLREQLEAVRQEAGRQDARSGQTEPSLPLFQTREKEEEVPPQKPVVRPVEKTARSVEKTARKAPPVELTYETLPKE